MGLASIIETATNEELHRLRSNIASSDADIADKVYYMELIDDRLNPTTAKSALVEIGELAQGDT